MKRPEELPDHARVWIYLSNRHLTPEETASARRALQEFLGGWAAHGEALAAGGDIYHDVAVVIAADEEKALASGCSIDTSVRFMKELGNSLGVDFFNRMIVAHGEPPFQLSPVHAFWAQRKAGLVSDDTMVLNPLVRTVGEWKSAFIQPFSQSWHAEMWAK